MFTRFAGRRLWLLSALLIACAPDSGGRPATGSRAAAGPPNILLLVVDTLRADHLSSYGYARQTSPVIDALAARGVRFDHHRAQAPCTFPSMNSLLTSQPVETFFGQPQGDMSIPANVATLPELLHTAGYVTAAFSASPIVRKNPTHFNHTGGFERGFDLFDDDCLYQAPGKVQGRRRFARPGSGRGFEPQVRSGEPHAAAARIDRGEPAGVDAAGIAHWIDLYDDEIAWVDARIAEVIASFEHLEPTRPSLVVLAADHGESFLEHGTLAHCRSLFDSEIRTPLIVAGSDLPRGVVSAVLSENLDIVPTLLDIAGIEVPPGRLAGRSLRATIERGADLPARLQTAAFSGWRAAVDGRHKLMFNPDRGRQHLFDLALDPGETADLAAEERRRAALLRRALDAERPVPEASLEAARESERQLRALGFL